MNKEQQKDKIIEIVKKVISGNIYYLEPDIVALDCDSVDIAEESAEALYNAGYRKETQFIENMKNVLEIEKKNAVKEFTEKVKSLSSRLQRYCLHHFDDTTITGVLTRAEWKSDRYQVQNWTFRKTHVKKIEVVK